VRQWQALTRCWQAIDASARAYDVYIKIREDAILLHPWHPALAWQNEEGVHVPSCLSWEGLNDKVAVVIEKDNARNFFLQPALDYFFNYDRLRALSVNDRIRNPGTFLLLSLVYNNSSIYQECASDLPVVRGSTRRNITCVTSSSLDCGPFKDQFPTLWPSKSAPAKVCADQIWTGIAICMPINYEMRIPKCY